MSATYLQTHWGKRAAWFAGASVHTARLIFTLIRAANQADAQGRAYPIRALAKVLDVSASGYYDWRDRAPSARAVDNELLGEAIVQIHAASLAIYGEPKIRAELRDESAIEHDAKFARSGRHRVERAFVANAPNSTSISKQH